MITKKIASITIVIALAAMFFSSSAFVNPLMAKTVIKSNDDSKDKTKDTGKDDPTTSNLSTDSSSSDKTKDTVKMTPQLLVHLLALLNVTLKTSKNVSPMQKEQKVLLQTKKLKVAIIQYIVH